MLSGGGRAELLSSTTHAVPGKVGCRQGGRVYR